MEREIDLTWQEPIPEAGVAAANALLANGKLHRYGETGGKPSEASALEEEFARELGVPYCVAMNSCGSTMFVALKASGVRPGDKVLTNCFTLAPVPGAIAHAGASPVLVDIDADFLIDLDDLARKADASGAKTLLLSHMRGHVCDMEALMSLCNRLGVTVVEDCAHTMGATWRGIPSGRHGKVAAYSMQTYKHINSGEGGFITTDDAEVAARAVLLSGSYMLYARHRAAPPPEAFDGLRLDTPNISGRMDNLRAAILRPQLKLLSDRVARWGTLYRTLESGLTDTPGLRLIPRPVHEVYVGSSFQFLLPDWTAGRIKALIARCAARGVELKWFGAPDPVAFTSRYDHWRYASPTPLPQTDRLLAGLIDMRVPLTFTPEDCALIARIIRAEVLAVQQSGEEAAEAVPLAD